MIKLDIKFKHTFWDVPAFNLVDPAITSSSVFNKIFKFANFRIFPLGLLLRASVKDPLSLAISNTLTEKGVLPLAAIQINTSLLVNNILLASIKANLELSSAFSTDSVRAFFPPGIIKVVLFFGHPKVGYNSTPSWTPILPDVQHHNRSIYH